MNILYLVNARIPTEKAHGVAIVKMAEALAKVGSRLELILPQRSAGRESIISEDLFNYYGADRVFKVKKLFCFDWQWLHQFGLGKAAFWLRTPILLLRLALIALFNQQQVIYTRDGLIAGLLSYFHQKVFLEIHRLPAARSRAFYLGVFKRLAGIITINGSEKESLLKEYGLPPEKVIVEHSAVNLADFVLPDSGIIRQVYGIAEDKIVVAYIGKFSIIGQNKDFNNLLATFKQALSQNDKLFLVLAGLKEEDLKIYNQALIRENLTNNAKLLPHVPFKQVKDYYALSDIFLLPYSAEVLQNYSLSPMKLFEYAACNRPIICPEEKNIAEIFSAEEVVFYQADNYNELGAKLVLLAQDNNLRARFAERALAKVKRYTWAARAAKVIAFIKFQIN